MKKIRQSIEKGRIKVGNFSISFQNRDSAQQTIEEIFNEESYQFKTINKNPFIIDAGSNIGIAALYFKTCYPESKILCFEPDPNAFKELQNNMLTNCVEGVTLINAAITQKEGQVDFFGELSGDTPDTRGNSIIKDWGMQRVTSTSITVKGVNLSNYIDQPVDFLKLDIEGAEQQVIKELISSEKIKWIQEMAIEIHQSNNFINLNNVSNIKSDLIEFNFKTEVIEKNIKGLFPDAVKAWEKKTNPRLFQLKAKRL